jgi:PAS domain S-box-containing protein
MSKHLVQFYESDDYLVEQMTIFIVSGLQAGGGAVVIATPAHREHLASCLGVHGFSADAESRGAAGYLAVDAAETLWQVMIDGWPDERRFNEIVGDLIGRAAARSIGGVYAFGEMVDLLCREGKHEAALHLELLWNKLACLHSFSLFCCYPMSAFAREEDAGLFLRVCNEHSRVEPTERHQQPTTAEEVLRTITQLQQKACALEVEVAKRRKVEKELSDFLENAIEGLHRVGPDGKVLWANKTELDMLGYTQEEYIGHPISEFHVDREVSDAILAKLQRGEIIFDCPARLRCKDGSIKHVRIDCNALMVNEEFVSTRCITRDVTERVRLEDELRKRVVQLAEADRRKDEFLAMLGHELRNPMAPIVTSLELMRLQADDPACVARAREIIARQVSLMTRIVDDLLDVSRVTRGKIELKQEWVILQGIVEQAVELTRSLFEERGHTLTLALPAEPLRLLIDPARLAQVLANLLSNAAKYTNAGGDIELSAHTDRTELVISVCDNGVGLTAELREVAFDLFVQGENSIAQARGGLGIGLTLVRNLVQLFGGRVEAFSEGLGRGSKFVVRLPLASVDSG